MRLPNEMDLIAAIYTGEIDPGTYVLAFWKRPILLNRVQHLMSLSGPNVTYHSIGHNTSPRIEIGKVEGWDKPPITIYPCTADEAVRKAQGHILTGYQVFLDGFKTVRDAVVLAEFLETRCMRPNDVNSQSNSEISFNQPRKRV